MSVARIMAAAALAGTALATTATTSASPTSARVEVRASGDVDSPAAISAQSPSASAEASRSARVLSRAPRGATGSFELSYDAAPLRAKATSDLSAPILVRVAELAPGRFRVEYMGLVSGAYDLAPFLEQVDGRAATFAEPLAIEVFTQLPPGHGTDVFGSSAPSFGLRAYYREALVALAILWLVVPAAAIGIRLARRRPAPPAALPAPEPTLAERLFAIVDDARARELSVDERGRLELLFLRTLRDHAAILPTAETAGFASATASPSPAPPSPDDLARAIESLRRDPEHGPAIRAVERWLHAASAGEAGHALDAIDGLRATTDATARSTGAAGASRSTEVLR